MCNVMGPSRGCFMGKGYTLARSRGREQVSEADLLGASRRTRCKGRNLAPHFEVTEGSGIRSDRALELAVVLRGRGARKCHSCSRDAFGQLPQAVRGRLEHSP